MGVFTDADKAAIRILANTIGKRDQLACMQYLHACAYLIKPAFAHRTRSILAGANLSAPAVVLTIPPNKGEVRCIQKEQDYAPIEAATGIKASSFIKDFLRSTLACKTVADLLAAYDAIMAGFADVTEVKNRLLKQVHDVVLVVRFDGMLVEIQLHLAEVLDLKGLMHLPYEIIRIEDKDPPIPQGLVAVSNYGFWFAENLKPEDLSLTASYY